MSRQPGPRKCQFSPRSVLVITQSPVCHVGSHTWLDEGLKVGSVTHKRHVHLPVERHGIGVRRCTGRWLFSRKHRSTAWPPVVWIRQICGCLEGWRPPSPRGVQGSTVRGGQHLSVLTGDGYSALRRRLCSPSTAPSSAPRALGSQSLLVRILSPSSSLPLILAVFPASSLVPCCAPLPVAGRSSCLLARCRPVSLLSLTCTHLLLSVHPLSSLH